MQRDNLLTFQEHSKNNILSLKENLVNMFIGVNLIILHFFRKSVRTFIPLKTKKKMKLATRGICVFPGYFFCN